MAPALFAAGLLVLLWLEFSPGVRSFLFGPDHRASVRLRPEGLLVTAELVLMVGIHGDYEKRLTLSDPGGRRLVHDFGFVPEATEIYRLRDGRLALTSGCDILLVRRQPLRLQSCSGEYCDTEADGRRYLGRIDFYRTYPRGPLMGRVDHGLRFIPPGRDDYVPEKPVGTSGWPAC